jgi:hypothetical protein
MKQAHVAVFRQGMIAGLLAYVAIILYYALFNLVTGRPADFTVVAIGEALFGQPGVPAIGAVIAYNGVHLIALMAFGTFAAWLLYEVEVHPVLWHTVLFVFIVTFLFAYWIVAIVAAPLASINPIVLVIGNTVGAAAMGVYLGWVHRGLLARIERFGDPDALLSARPSRRWRA